MSRDMFGNMPSSIPQGKGDQAVERVDFTEQEMGARKSHVPKLQKNPKMTIQHVTQGR